MLDQAAWDGVNAMLDQYIGIDIGDHVIVAYTEDSSEPAAWVAVALERRGLAPRLLPMAPLIDDTIEDRLRALLPPAGPETRLVVITLELHTMSHTGVFRDVIDSLGADRCIVVRAMSACAELFAYAMVPPHTLDAVNTSLLKRLTRAQRLAVSTDGGTELEIGLDSSRYRWINNRGRRREGSFMILPAGEVATFPATVSGTLVADFALHVNMHTELDTRLALAPISVSVRDGEAVDFQCLDKAMAAFVDECLARDGAKVVGELGFGTNFGVREATAINSHINERVPGVHLGFGQHNQRGILPSTCDIHIDLIARGGRIWCDDDPVPLDLERIEPSWHEEAPATAEDEDVFSPEIASDDCCGADQHCPVPSLSLQGIR